jgi:hypothetical protein
MRGFLRAAGLVPAVKPPRQAEEILLKSVYHLVIRRHEFAALLFRQGDVDAVIHPDAHLGGNINGANQKWLERKELRRRG